MKIILTIDETIQGSKEILEAENISENKEKVIQLIDERVQEIHIKKKPPIMKTSEANEETN